MKTSSDVKRGKLPVFGKRPAQAFSITALLSIFAYGALSHAQNAGENAFAESFRKLKRDESLQFDFTTAPPPPETPKWVDAFADFIGGFFNILGPFLYLLFWLGIGALIMGVIYLIITTLMAAKLGTRAKKEKDLPPPLYQPEQAQARILLDEIDALAAQGKYAEAVHTLLFRSIQDIDANRPNVIRRSLTSREIGELTILTSGARDVFASIASIVERSFFGGQIIGQADFDTARAAYAELTSQASQWALGRGVDQTKTQAA